MGCDSQECEVGARWDLETCPTCGGVLYNGRWGLECRLGHAWKPSQIKERQVKSNAKNLRDL
jgi:hypothetical protein